MFGVGDPEVGHCNLTWLPLLTSTDVSDSKILGGADLKCFFNLMSKNKFIISKQLTENDEFVNERSFQIRVSNTALVFSRVLRI